MHRPARALVALFALCPLVAANASGFLFGDNGARALSLGGAFAAQADDLTAIQHNPAGLAQQQGFSFLVDGALLNHDVTFTRKDTDGAAPGQAVSNQGGLFFLPVLGVGYGQRLADRRFTASFGVYGPPSVGRYSYPEPNYSKTEGTNRYAENPIKFAPQRYGLIKNDIIILFPSLSAAYEVLPSKLSVGVSLQYVYADIMFRQAVTAIPYSPTGQAKESPDYDAVVNVHQSGQPTFTGIVGLLFQPTPMVQVGTSYRPPVAIHTRGTIDIEPGEFLQKAATIEGNKASFQMNLPQEFKLGVRVTPLEALGLNAELVYQGWQSISEFVLVPEDITVKQLGGEAEPLDPLHIPKGWHHAFSGRFGAEYRFWFGLVARAGVLFEQSAIPERQFHIDFAHPQRVFVTGGLEYPIGPVNLLASGAVTPYQTLDITDSAVSQANVLDPSKAAVIGNGTYVTGGWIATVGIRGNFGGTRAATP